MPADDGARRDAGVERASNDYREQLGEWLDIEPRLLDGLHDHSVEALALSVQHVHLASERVRAQHLELLDLRQALVTDTLTGIANRRMAERRLDEEWRRATRNHRHLAVFSVDIDGLKAVNDSRGHAAGDQLIVAVAQSLCRTVRTEDLVARIGGDEFVVVCPEFDPSAAVEMVRKLTAAARNNPPTVHGETIPVRISVGWAGVDGALSAVDLLEQADQRMYAAKQSAAAGG